MESIGASVVNGAFGAIFGMLGKVPILFWVVLAFFVVAAVFVIRYITDWKVVIPLVIAFFLISEVLVWRAHWINMGKAEVEAQLAAYKKTNGLVIACYSRNANQTYLWDRSQGKCLRGDGAVEP
jgi:hypothetical protein